MLKQIGLSLGAAVAVALLSTTAPAQTGHRLFSVRNDFFLQDRATGVVRPFEMWTTRIANAFMSQSFADRVIAALDEYQRYGVNTVCVSIQGGELGPAKNVLYPKTLNADGTLDLTSPVWARLDRFLDETDRRGIAVNVMIWYHRRSIEVPDDNLAVAATQAAAAWLRATGHEHYFYDVANEFDHYAYRLPGQTVKRPLFSTLQGALRLIYTVQQADPGKIVGLSPLAAIICPVGTLTSEPGQPYVEADVIINHGFVVDPQNTNAYRFGVFPVDQLAKPYVNNEFFAQLRYELRVYTNPRTNQLTYGHWDAFTIQNYLAQVALMRTYNGAANVFSHFQQYAAPAATEPEAEIGPAGTQPESTLTPNEPSMHWVYRAIASMRKFAGTPTVLDFDAGHGRGLETALTSQWSYANAELHQLDANASPAWSRIAADDGDLEIAFDARFLGAPGSTGFAGVRVGDPTPAGDAWAAEVMRDTLRVTRGTVVTSVARASAPGDRYVLRMRGGRVQLDVDGRTAIDSAGSPVGNDQNLLLVTDRVPAAFDNVRATSFRDTDFEDGTSGAWAPLSGAWAVVPNPRAPAERVWETTVPATQQALAADDRVFGDLRWDATLDVAAAGPVGLRFRAADATDPTSDGYALVLAASGDVALEQSIGALVTTLATAQTSITSSRVAVSIVAEGNRIAARVDGVTVFDVVDTSPRAPRRGALQLVAGPGVTRVDDLFVAVGPDRLPEAVYRPGVGPALAKDSVLEFVDRDGRNDLAFLSFEVAPGTQTFIDLTVFLHPAFGLFKFAATPDGRGYRFTLLIDVPVVGGPWRLRLTSRDHAGQTAVRVFTVQ